MKHFHKYLNVIIITVIILILTRANWVHAQKPAADEKLGMAVKQKRLNAVRVLLMQGANPNARMRGVTPVLNWAAGHRQYEIVRALVSKGADVNLRTIPVGSTALHSAAFAGDTSIVTYLLKRGANPDSKNRYGTTPLMEAAMKGRTIIVKILLQKHADPNVINKNGETPLIDAQEFHHLDIVKLLKHAGAKK